MNQSNTPEEEMDESQIMQIEPKQAVINWSIPYHPEIKKMGLQRDINQMLDTYYGNQIRVRIAWKNTNTNLSAKMRMMVIKQEISVASKVR